MSQWFCWSYIHSSNFSYRSFSHLSRSGRHPGILVAHFPAAAPHPPQNTFSPCPDPLGKEFFRKRKFPPAQPPRQNNKGNKSRGSEEKKSRGPRKSVKKKRVKIVTFHVYGANVTIVGAANRSQLLPSHDPHAPLSSALAAASPPSLNTLL